MSAKARVVRSRLDLLLVERGLAGSRRQAQTLVMAGRVHVDDKKAMKPGAAVAADAAVRVEEAPRHVGRGALKLAPVLDLFGLAVTGRVAVDIGASTGGFTQVLLERGARRVYAVDVGHGQLHERLRADPRVVARDRVNARFLSTEVVPEPARLATIDVSFISLRKILPAVANVLAGGADVVALVKPQFEVGRREVGRGGLVKDPEKHRACLLEVARQAQELGYSVRAAAPSPIRGNEGNREFFLHLVKGAGRAAEEELVGMVERAVSP